MSIIIVIPYSGKLSRGPIFADWSLGKFSRFNFQGRSIPKAHPYRHIKKFVGLIFADILRSVKIATVHPYVHILYACLSR